MNPISLSPGSMSSATDFPIVLEDSALKRVAALIAKDGREGVFLRLGVKGGGCSGLEYLMKLDDKARENDHVYIAEGIEVRLDPKSARFLAGSTFKYTGNLMGGGFTFDNPNAERSCGCGTSFTPRKAS